MNIPPEKQQALAAEFGRQLVALVNENLKAGTPLSSMIYQLDKQHFTLQLDLDGIEQKVKQELLARSIVRGNGFENLPPQPGQ